MIDERTEPRIASRQPDTTEIECEFHAWPANAVGRVLTETGAIRSWMTRKPCGCLAAAAPETVLELEGGEVTIRAPLACVHGKDWLQGGRWT